MIPNAQVATIPEGTHASNYSAPDDLARLVKKFLKALPGLSN
jgi:hypothetical protein